MANPDDSVLYVGVTSNIQKRVLEHKNHINASFTTKYNCIKLVYYEQYSDIRTAISREKVLKKWAREWKEELIATINKDWQDLSINWV